MVSELWRAHQSSSCDILAAQEYDSSRTSQMDGVRTFTNYVYPTFTGWHVLIPSRTPFRVALPSAIIFFLEENSAQSYINSGFSIARCMLHPCPGMVMMMMMMMLLRWSKIINILFGIIWNSHEICFSIEPPGPVNVPLSENTFKTGLHRGGDSSQSGMSKPSRAFPPKWSILHHQNRGFGGLSFGE